MLEMNCGGIVTCKVVVILFIACLQVVKREICAVVTKGTLTEGEMLSLNPDASYLMAVSEKFHGLENQQERIFGVCVVDVATSRIILGQVKY